jgi:protein tyrosine phosphatase type 4A
MSSSNKQMKEARSLPVTIVDRGRLRFVITDAPDERSMPGYIAFLKENGVVHLARACEPCYATKPLEAAGIRVHDLYFEDGQIPPPQIVKQWLDVVEKSFIDPRSPDLLDERERVGVHCVAGFGRAPLLVTLALIEDGMAPLEAAQFVRAKRKGALNTVQLRWLETYQRTRPKWTSGGFGSGGASKCLLM